MSLRVPRLIYLVLDGASDSLKDPKTSLEYAYTPNLDEIARISKAGLVHVLGPGVAPESDSAVFSLLGYNPYKYYVGRGVVEAYGIGVKPKPDYEIALRGNLATIDKDRKRIIDRRCGRNISDDEGKKLVKSIEYIDLKLYDGYAKVYHGIGHRVVVIIGSKRFRLSKNISNTDPGYKRVGVISEAVKDFKPIINLCEPLDSTESSRITSELVNKFTEIVYEKLSKNLVNKLRIEDGKLPCNIILLRDAGLRPGTLPNFQYLHGFKMAAIVEMPVERGIADMLGLAIGEVPPPTPNKEHDYPIRVNKALEMLNYADSVYIHLKGPDEPGHDGDFNAKVKAIEDIDRYFMKNLLNNIDIDKTSFIITSDHSTPPSQKGHTDDPVPIFVYSPNLKADKLKKFSEREAAKGSIGVLTGGWDIIPVIKKMIWG